MVEGTSKMYRMLQHGKSRLGKPLFAYLSGSPSALSRSIKKFLKVNSFPPGVTIFKKSFWSSDTPMYKLKWLKNLNMKFQGFPMLLFGDSGEKDPFIYSSFVLLPLTTDIRIVAVFVNACKLPYLSYR